MKNAIELLKKIDILVSLSEGELAQLYSQMRLIRREKGEILFHEGDAGNEMYIVLSGKVSISVKTPDGDNVEIAVITGGNFFGEMSIFENAPRSATCTTAEKTDLLAFDRSSFYILIKNHPNTAIKIMYRMLSVTTSRLQKTGAFLSEMVTWGEEARKRAVTDEMTGFYNRRFLDDSLEDKFAMAKLDIKPLSLVMIDLDNFGKLNKMYGEQICDTILLSVIPVFRAVFRDSDILARYGGDEFTFILPDTKPETAHALCCRAVKGLREIDLLQSAEGSIKKITCSIGIASCPDHADTVQSLKENADRALYSAKDKGRDRTELYTPVRYGLNVKSGKTDSGKIQKRLISSIAEKNRVVENITAAIEARDNFLLIGHRNPDEDCIASMVAFALILVKFSKNVSILIYRENHQRFPYLLNICRYNSISFIEDETEISDIYSTIAAFDTPKPSMIEKSLKLSEMISDGAVRRIEIDHHLEADSRYFGDTGYCLVDEASSTCELIGYLAMKLSRRKELLEKYQINDIFSRNFILAVITGIISDSKMGKYLKSNREKRFYHYFSSLFNELLLKKTDKTTGNFSTMNDIFGEIEKLSGAEDECFKYFIKRKKKAEHISYAALEPDEMKYLYRKYDQEIIVAVARYTADILAEESGFVSLVAYFDNPEKSNLLQMRMRRSHNYRSLDLRKILEKLEITNGGGHPGAIGFRIEQDLVDNYEGFLEKLISTAEEMIRNT